MKHGISTAFCLVATLVFSQKPVSERSIYNKFKERNTNAYITAKATTFIQHIDSTYTWNFDNSIQAWRTSPDQRTIAHSYDANMNMTSMTRQFYGSQGWQNSDKTDQAFDANNNPLMYMFSAWNGTAWYIVSKNDLGYNSNGKLIVDAKYNWNGATNTLENSTRTTYTYDAVQNNTFALSEYGAGTAWLVGERSTKTYDVNHNLLTNSVESYTNSTWVKSFKQIYAYGSGSLVISYTYQAGVGNNWVNDGRETNVYDINSNPVMSTTETWTNNAWVNVEQATFTCVANQIAAVIYKEWSGSAWVNSSKSTYTYNSAGKALNILEQEWISNAWVNSRHYDYTYDAHNNETTRSSQDWNNNNAWVKDGYQGNYWDNNDLNYTTVNKWYQIPSASVGGGDSTRVYYTTVTGLKEDTKTFGEMTLFPNPSNGQLTLRTQKNTGEIEVYNLVGTRVFQGKIESENTYLNLSTLPKGIYIMTVSQGKMRQNLKIALE